MEEVHNINSDDMFDTDCVTSGWWSLWTLGGRDSRAVGEDLEAGNLLWGDGVGLHAPVQNLLHGVVIWQGRRDGAGPEDRGDGVGIVVLGKVFLLNVVMWTYTLYRFSSFGVTLSPESVTTKFTCCSSGDVFSGKSEDRFLGHSWRSVPDSTRKPGTNCATATTHVAAASRRLRYSTACNIDNKCHFSYTHRMKFVTKNL